MKWEKFVKIFTSIFKEESFFVIEQDGERLIIRLDDEKMKNFITADFDDDFEYNDTAELDKFLIDKENRISDEIIITRTYIESLEVVPYDKQRNESFNNTSYETSLKTIRNSSMRSIRMEKELSKKDYSITNESIGITFVLTKIPSMQFFIEIISNNDLNFRYFRDFGRYFDLFGEKNDDNIRSFIKFICERIFTPNIFFLKIASRDKTDLSVFQALLNSYLFNLSYNLNFLMIRNETSNDDSKILHTAKNNKLSMDELEVPKRTYNDELVMKYILSLSNVEPFAQYLSFYHIVEYHIEDVAKEEIIRRVKDELTKPDFSYRNNRKLLFLIEMVKKETKNYSYSSSEEFGLILVLKKYVNIDDLKRKIKEVSDDLIDCYSGSLVKFSGGNAIPFDSSDNENIYNCLAKRLYATRNAIVHNKSEDLKESRKYKFNPLKHRQDLNIEIILLKLISELIIINDSKPI